ncbi:rhodanese-like domain-containing protein [Amycolatopsis jejuensis]|uniref:rhodanese-like domain-containing protein n=1 Tax=Amycolatopsis jejuensis TaxID=330084 RepID=UPI000525D761|nr:rhodanese-like domain-containing protein [Amycolatopsis jejuensis]
MASGSHALVLRAEEIVPEITVEDLARELAAGETILVDVRDAEETWKTGTIPGAHNVSRGVIEWFADPESKFHLEFMDPAKRVVVFSMGGERSSVAGLALMEVLGYTDVADLRAGLRGWLAAGYQVAPVEGRSA